MAKTCFQQSRLTIPGFASSQVAPRMTLPRGPENNARIGPAIAADVAPVSPPAMALDVPPPTIVPIIAPADAQAPAAPAALLSAPRLATWPATPTRVPVVSPAKAPLAAPVAAYEAYPPDARIVI